MLKFVASIVAAFMLLCIGAHAGERNLKPGIIGDDNREMIGNSPGPWTAIGHINVSGHRSNERCTGTRIAPGLVLTSAHCVVNVARKSLHPAKDIHFVAGVNKDKSVGHTTARCVLLPDDFAVDKDSRVLPDLRTVSLSEAFLSRDVALVVLKDDIGGAGAIGITTAPLGSDVPLQHAGYPADRRQVLMIDKTCKVLSSFGDLILTDCDTVAGSSGGPLLVEQGGEWKIAAVMGATTNGSGNLAVPLTVWPNMPGVAKCPDD